MAYNQGNHQPGGNRGSGNQGRQHSGGGGSSLDTSRIKFTDIDTELFNEVAESAAKTIANCQSKDGNKSTQLRKFYDELCMWDERVRLAPDSFKENLPFIKMMNAKAAYAQGRKLVDSNFSDLVAHCIKQVNTPQDLKIFKTFFEAFMGFLKRYRD